MTISNKPAIRLQRLLASVNAMRYYKYEATAFRQRIFWYF